MGHHAPTDDMPVFQAAAIGTLRDGDAFQQACSVSSPQTMANIRSASSKSEATHAEQTRRIRELQEECQYLREEMAARTTAGSNVSENSDELSGLHREVCYVRARLRVARLAELEARKKADALPELVVKNEWLLKRVAEGERNLSDIKTVVGGFTWSAFWRSIICNTPEKNLLSADVSQLPV